MSGERKSMKCQVCNFDETTQQEKKEWEKLYFIEIDGNFSIRNIVISDGTTEISIYACPKCFSLRIDAYR